MQAVYKPLQYKYIIMKSAFRALPAKHNGNSN